MSIKDHPNYAVINTLVLELINTVRNRQSEYFAKNRKYFQGLRIPSVGQLDGTIDVDINPALRPDDQESSWVDFSPLDFQVGRKLPMHVRVDTYASKSGMGWVLRAEFWKDLGDDGYGTSGIHWVYLHNEGPLTMPGIYGDWHIEPDEA